MTPSSIDQSARAMLLTMGDAAARALVLGAVAGLLLTVFRVKRSAFRLWVWTAVLAGAILMPAIARVSPALRVPVPMLSPVVLPSVVARTDLRSADEWRTSNRSALRTDPIPGANETPSRPSAGQALSPPAAASIAPTVRRNSWIDRLSWPIAAAGIYLLGVAFFLLRMLAGWLTAARLDRRSEPVTDSDTLARLRQCASAARLARPPRLAETPDIFVPITMAVVRPVVLLPESWREWPSTTLDAVFVHELAHIARADALTQRLSLIYRAATWFSPFSWWLQRHLVELGEQASDDATLEAGVDRTVYAESLVGFFAAIGRAPARADWHVAMASGASVERRVERILNWTQGRVRRLTKAAMIGVGAAVGAVAVLTASVRPVARSVTPVTPALAQIRRTTAAPPIRAIEPARPSQARALSSPASPEVAIGPSTSESPAALQAASLSGRVDLTGVQMIVLLVDVGSSSPEVRQRLVDAASREVHASNIRFSVGLDGPHVWRVATTGSQVDTMQDFMWDVGQVDAALNKVAAASTDGSSPAAAVAIRSVCDGLAGLPRGNKYFHQSPALQAAIQVGTLAPIDLNRDAKGVLFFNAGTSLTAEETASVQSACGRQNVAFGAIAIQTSPTTPTPAPPATPTMPAISTTAMEVAMLLGQFGKSTQLTSMVFDLQRLPGDDLARAVDTATQYADTLGQLNLVSISILGSADPVQNFTSDKTEIRSALARVKAMPRPAAGPPIPIAGVTRTCGAMVDRERQSMLDFERAIGGNLPPPGFIRGKELLYFGSTVERGLEPPHALRAAAYACTDASVPFYTLAASPAAVAGSPPAISAFALKQLGQWIGVSVIVVPHQADSPVTLASSRPVLDGGYVSARIRNDSGRPVRSVTLGALVNSDDLPATPPQVFTARGPAYDIAPGASIDISTYLIEGNPFGVLGRLGAQAELGVVEVEFVDGTKWTYDLKAKGRFER